MEVIGALVFLVVILVGFAFLAKNQRTVSWWMQTPHYDMKYKQKMLKRQIEDAQEELNRIEDLK